MPIKNLVDHFDRNLFIADMKAQTKAEVLEELLDLFVLGKFVKKKNIVLEMLNQREKLGSTGIGKGVAVPHGRTTATGDVIIGFGRSKSGINFDAIDKKPVYLFFMVIAPPKDEGNVYLPVLGSLVTILKNSKKREKLLSIESFDELISIISGE